VLSVDSSIFILLLSLASLKNGAKNCILFYDIIIKWKYIVGKIKKKKNVKYDTQLSLKEMYLKYI
jgi:hypothetical protein